MARGKRRRKGNGVGRKNRKGITKQSRATSRNNKHGGSKA